MDTEYRDPSYYEAATRIYQTSAERWRVIDDEYKIPSLTWFKLMYEYSRVVKADIFLVICLALLWTALRSFMTNMVFKVCFVCFMKVFKIKCYVFYLN